MNRTVLLVSLVILALGVWMYLSLRAEPVEAIAAKWAASGHADASSESFSHWNEDEPPLVPANCAKCHSTYGYLDYVGEDGSAAGSVESNVPIGSLVSCRTCHNEAAYAITAVTFPSGDEVTSLGHEAICMQCHQGRRSTVDVEGAIAGLDADAVSADLGFVNVHYAIAAATQMGSAAQGAYQYPDQTYAGRFEHVEQMDVCIECHDPHSQAVDPQSCSPCHLSVVDYADMLRIRSDGADYDGDGDDQEGIAGEIETLHGALYEAIQDYAARRAGVPIVYQPSSFPYWFVDSNGNGEPDGDEVAFPNQYADWTPRLMRTTYTYHFVAQDRGAYAHNPRYVLQVLYDGLVDLGQAIDVETAQLARP
jgi:hypothetical protein